MNNRKLRKITSILKKIKWKKKKIEATIGIYYQLYILKKRKLELGAAYTKKSDWIPSDIYVLNVALASDWHILFDKIRFTNIMAEHVWEHLTEEDTLFANQNCYKYLKDGGRLRVAVPDGHHPDKGYIDDVKIGGTGKGAEDHKILYTYDVLKNKLENVGFDVELLEYWDEFGEFHFKNWDNEGGLIRRSRRYDQRNINGELIYTSLIVDAIKK